MHANHMSKRRKHEHAERGEPGIARASRGTRSETSVYDNVHTWILEVLNLLHMLEHARTSS